MIETTFGNLIAYVRKKKNYTIAQLSQISNVSERQIQRIEASTTIKGIITTINLLSNALHINLIELATISSEFANFEEYETYIEIEIISKLNNTMNFLKF